MKLEIVVTFFDGNQNEIITFFVGGGVEGPSGGATDSVVMVTGFGGGDDGDEEGEGRDVRRDGWRHCR